MKFEPREQLRQFREGQWHAALVDPVSWTMTAPTLMHAAQILWPRSTRAMAELAKDPRNGPVGELMPDILMSPIAFMLAAFAIENLLKGLWVRRMGGEQPFVKGDRRIARVLSTHKLIIIAEKAGIECDVARRELLDHLTAELEWGGRYWRPKNPSDLFPDVPGKPGEVKLRSFHDSDWPPVLALYHELYRQLRP